MMNFKLHKDFSEIDSVTWNTLVEQSIADTPFSRYEYLAEWWQTLGGGEWKSAELVLISATEDQGGKTEEQDGKIEEQGGRTPPLLVGIAPLFIAEYEGQQALMLAGSIEISDYLDLIVREADVSNFLSGLIDFLDSSGMRAGGLDLSNRAGGPRPYNWSAIDWYNLPDNSPTLAALKAESEKRGWNYHEEVYRPTPRIALNGSFEEYLAHIDKKQRHEIKRKMRRAAESDLNVRFLVIDREANIENEINNFFDLMVQDPNKANFLHPAMREQMTVTIRTAFEQDFLWLAYLEVDGVKVAASLNFDYKNKLWGYNSGVSRAHMELSPGWVLLGHVIQWCCENGRHEFDFMRGDEDYKYRFGGVNRFVMRAKVISR